MKSLEGKAIVVTGATGILGESIIHALANEGAYVGVLGRNEEVANARVMSIQANGGKAIALIADVLNEQQLNAACNKMLSAYGKIDGLVNAAGGNLPGAVIQPDKDIFELNIDALDSVLKLNLFGTILPTQIFGKAIKDSAGKGSIVNISSVAAKAALTRVLGYSLAKAAVESYTKWFSVELANRYGSAFRMNAVVPGFFLTEQNRSLLTNEDGTFTDRGNKIIAQTPFSRLGVPDELDGAIIWLLGDQSTFVTGTTITIDGGFTAFSGV